VKELERFIAEELEALQHVLSTARRHFEADPDSARPLLDELQRITARSRALIGRMHSGPADSLHWLAREAGRRGIECRIEVGPERFYLEEQLSAELFAIARDALAQAAGQVVLSLRWVEGMLVLSLSGDFARFRATLPCSIAGHHRGAPLLHSIATADA
jgi:hypothetical protein